MISKQNGIAACYSVLSCFINIVPAYYLAASLTVPQHEIEKFIKHSLYQNHQIITTTYSSSVIFISLTAVIMLVGTLGSILGTHFNDKYGRKVVVFMIAPVLNILSSVLHCMALIQNRAEILMVGRIICGVSIGISGSAVPVYIAEISPAEIRARLGSLLCVANGIGTSLGLIISLPILLGSRDTLPYLNCVPALFAIFGPISYPWAIESPRYVCLIKKRDEEAVVIMKQLGVTEQRDIQDMLHEFHSEPHEECESAVTLFSVVTNKFYGATVLLSAIISGCWSLSGVYAITVSTVEFFTEIGMDRFHAQYLAAVGESVCDLTFSLLSPLPLHYFSHRFILLSTHSIIILMQIGMFTQIFLLQNYHTLPVSAPYVVLVFFIITLAAHCLGPATLSFIIPSEISATELRSLNSGITNTVRSALQAFGVLYFYPTFLKVGAFAFVPMMAVMVSGTFVVAVFLPETKHLTVSEAVDKWKQHWEAMELWFKCKKPAVDGEDSESLS